MDGNRVAMLEALPDADVLIAATGVIDVPAEALRFLKDGVLIANGGHHERESRSTDSAPARRCGPA